MTDQHDTPAPTASPLPQATLGPFEPKLDTAHLAPPRPLPPEHPVSFLKQLPDRVADGFDTDGQVYDDRIRFAFGQWDIEAADADEDLGVMRSLHSRAIDEFKGMAQTIASAKADEDLTPTGRLKMVARLVEGRIDSLASTAERELARVDERIAREEAALMTTAKVTDPAQAVLHDSIRRHIAEHGLQPGSVKEGGYQTALQGADTETLLAIASAPAYLSGLDAKTYEKVRRELAERLAPERVQKIATLRTGKHRALQALSALHTKAHRFVDFKRARELAERGNGVR